MDFLRTLGSMASSQRPGQPSGSYRGSASRRAVVGRAAPSSPARTSGRAHVPSTRTAGGSPPPSYSGGTYNGGRGPRPKWGRIILIVVIALLVVAGSVGLYLMGYAKSL